MICELVTTIAIHTAHTRPVTARRVCLAALIRKAAREHAIVVDLKHGRVIMPPQTVRLRPVFEVLRVTR